MRLIQALVVTTDSHILVDMNWIIGEPDNSL